MYTESEIRFDDEVYMNPGWGCSIEFEVVLENAATRLGDREGTYVRDSYGNHNTIRRSYIDRLQTIFDIEAQEWTNVMARRRHTGFASWDGYVAASVVDAALEPQASGGIGISVKVIDKLEFYA